MNLPDLTRPTLDWTVAQCRRAAILCTAICLPVAIGLALVYDSIFFQSDTPNYLLLATGQPAMMPFASRQLGPLIVRGLIHLGITLQTAYFLEGTVAMLLLFATVLYFLLRSGAPRFMFAAIFGMVFWAWQYNALVMPDLLYAALLCIFLLLLDRQRFLLAGLMMLPLAVSRESTLLTLAVYLVAGWRRLRLTESVTAIASMVAGILIVKRLTANALPNNEHISPFLYLLAKMPWALLKNFLGLYPWSNVYPECEVPRFQMALHLGPVHAVGICRFEPYPPLLLLFYCLSSFGLLPLLFLALRRLRKPLAPTENSSRADFLVRFCVVYGVLSFAIAGLLGETFQRLFAYSWPVFLIALPILLTRARATFLSNRAALVFLTIHLLLSWCQFRTSLIQLIPIEIVFWIAGYVLLRRTLIAAPVPA
jgi:hypothetical protein